jgi:hypothetical protein
MGYLRIIDSEGKQVVTGTRQITRSKNLEQVKFAMREGLEDLGIDVPDYLSSEIYDGRTRDRVDHLNYFPLCLCEGNEEGWNERVQYVEKHYSTVM